MKKKKFEWKVLPGFTTAGHPQRDARKRWANHSVIQRTSKTGSLHVNVLTALYGMREEMKNYVKIIQKELKNTLEDFLAVFGLSLGPRSEKKWYGNLRWHTQWVLESNCRENAADLRRIRSSDIPLYQCLGEMRIKKQRRRKDMNTLQWQYANTFELLLKMVVSVNQLSLYGAVANMIKRVAL